MKKQVSKSHHTPHLPLQKKESKRWVWVVNIYIVWNVCAYTSKMLFGVDRELYDKVYWMNERIFVLLAFLALSVPDRYKWVQKAMILVAVWKMAYLIMVITNIIKPNDWASLMGVLFMIVLGYVTIRWEKSGK